MSLSALLNDEDRDIISRTNINNNNDNSTIVAINKNSTDVINSTGTINTTFDKQSFLRTLNHDMNQLKLIDTFEMVKQDWDFINYQEFELITEWNSQIKEYSNNHNNSNANSQAADPHPNIIQRINNNRIYKKEWKEYLAYKNIYKLHNNMTLNSKGKHATTHDHTAKVRNNKNTRDLDGHIQDTISNNSKHSGEGGNRSNNIEYDDLEEDDDQFEMDYGINDDVEDYEDDDIELEEMDAQDEDADDDDDEDDDDQDFTIGYQKKKKKKKNKRTKHQHKGSTADAKDKINTNNQKHAKEVEVTMDSDISSISKELIKLCERSKFKKVKKRRFTNLMITKYNNTTDNNSHKYDNEDNDNNDENGNDSNIDENNNVNDTLNELKIKITLKQNHCKKLKRLINDDKRKKDKELQELKKQQELQQQKLLQQQQSQQQQQQQLLDSSTAASSTNNSPLKKKRPFNNNDDDDTSVIDENDDTNNNINSNNDDISSFNRRKTHDLPTYGIKMSAKEARAIQRHYDNTYITIWKDLARKDSNRMWRLYQQIQSIRSTNFKKTSSLCAREARKWQARNFKQIKDYQTRARRGIREMSNFWKKNEREERETKKKAEKIALENAKKEEEERESKRQAKKLNFLLTQTELYSHFIGRKIKTDEIEGNDNNHNNDHSIDLEKTNATKNNFHEIDFDNENDDQLRLKAAENASSVLAQTRAQAKAFDKTLSNEQEMEKEEEEEEELNFQNPTSLGDISLEQPKLLACTLKEYQLKGLNWLANLYDQGINGILADEMGLGKTVQSISVLAHLAEHYNIWGPFLVVTPASTLHNWVNEIAKFVPDFKILPYWGNANDRKILRKFWDRKNLRYGKDAPFHVMVTSYQMVVSDVNYLQKMRWQYMILDEAQAIKSSQSSRWKNLLSFHCRNRLLLTGTPIQNNMQELWALLHFIMPSLFDSHDEFSDWFSKDIESHAEGNGQLNQQQLRRLHMILKPFMLRRIKKNVQSELGDKIEIDVLCDLTQRQHKLYQVLRSQMSSNYDMIENSVGSDESSGDQNLMNAVMQFRKVCNHPDLFERADVDSPFSFVTFGKTNTISKTYASLGNSTTNNSSTVSMNTINGQDLNGNQSNLNHHNLVDVLYSSRNPITFHLPKLVYDELLLPNYNNSIATFNKLTSYTMNIFNADTNGELTTHLARITGISRGDLSKIHHMTLIKRIINEKDNGHFMPEDGNINKHLIIKDMPSHLETLSNQTTNGILSSLLNIKGKVYEDQYLNSLDRGYREGATATPVNIEVLGSSNFSNKIQKELFEPTISQALSEIPSTTQYNMHVKKKIPIEEFPKTGMYPESLNKSFSSTISMPSMDRFITESAKLKKLDEMLPILKEQGHRVLVYFQMTKMMDLMEEYLTYRQYNHIRLDGSSKLEDRRDLVNDWQTKPEIFVFLLSTRAGGLGINLTAADTVIFYDSDWNPTIDSQAMDRAHRLGQTRQVTVYRLLVRGTIEERMRDRAKQKEQVQQVVMEGKTQDHHVRTIEANVKINNNS